MSMKATDFEWIKCYREDGSWFWKIAYPSRIRPHQPKKGKVNP